MKNPDKQPDTFENTYPKHSFSELVRLSLIVARWIAGRPAVVQSTPDRPCETGTKPTRSPCQETPSQDTPYNIAIDLSLEVRRQRQIARERVRSR